MIKPAKPTSPIKSSTQEFIEIQAVKDDILLFKDYSGCVIINSGTTNFDLLSQEEQGAMIFSYSSLLNSLSFPVQILILSKQMNISSYLQFLDLKINLQIDQTMNQRLINYREFIKAIVKKNTVLEKKFYFVIPFFSLEMGPLGATTRSLKSLNKEYVFARAKTSLYPKKDHLLRLLKKMGLGAKVLYEQEIIELYYNLYNPSPSGRKLAPIKSYTQTIS